MICGPTRSALDDIAKKGERTYIVKMATGDCPKEGNVLCKHAHDLGTGRFRRSHDTGIECFLSCSQS